ncbi:hypothetical protein CHS0354_023791 [Potamilus streckersoni]|uniref:Solute-binding protein family 3/N-terminal domain-containing protein n=1 Tax=Potamilus streckersoni TaxID=2493646 RepID=A0AAE0RZ03_9BIVA|nr:hypothetical protein CHS0354_023791 [Potamilus streckersoni]
MAACGEKKNEDKKITASATVESFPQKSENTPSSIDKSSTLYVGVLDYSMPLSDATPDSLTNKRGIYVDIAEDMARLLGKKLHLYFEKDYFFERPIRKGLLSGNCQIQLGIADPKREFIRKNKAVPTIPYMSIGYTLVLPKNTLINKIEDLRGKKVSFLSGSPPQTTLLLLESKLEPVVTDAKALDLLDRGLVDAAFIWGPKAGYLNKFKYNRKFIVLKTPIVWDVVMGLKVEDLKLKEELQKRFSELKRNIKKLEEEYGMHTDKSMSISNKWLPEQLRSKNSL